MQKELIDQYKEKIVRCWIDYIFYFGARVISRGEVGHKILKNDLGNSRGDFKEVVDKFHLLLNRIYDSIRQQEAQKSRKVMQRFNIDLFENVKRKIIIYALKLILQQYHRLQESAVLENLAKLPDCIYRYVITLDLPCAHDIKYRLDYNKRLKLVDFYGHQRYDQWAYKDNKSEILDLVQNPRVIKSKGRLKGALGSAYTLKLKLN